MNIAAERSIRYLRENHDLTGVAEIWSERVDVDWRGMDLAVQAFGRGHKLTDLPEAELTVFRQDGQDYLTWRVQLRQLDGTEESSMPVCFVDAHTGDIVLSYDNLQNVSLSDSDKRTCDMHNGTTMEVPAGASNLTFTISGGSGDADLYVKFGSQPTTSSYDCRPYKSGNNETCTFAAPSAGTWHVAIRAYSSYSGVTLEGSYTEPGAGGWSGSASPNMPTVDNGQNCTSLSVSASGDASLVKLDLSGTHDYRSILRGTLAHNGITVEAFPTGTFASGAGTFSFSDRALSGMSGDASGTWTLCIIDTDGYGDTGVLNTWSVHD